MSKATKRENGDEWAPSRDGKLQIRLEHLDHRIVNIRGGGFRSVPGESWCVSAMYTGTHDLAPLTRRFDGPNAEKWARSYANKLWEGGW